MKYSEQEHELNLMKSKKIKIWVLFACTSEHEMCESGGPLIRYSLKAICKLCTLYNTLR